MADIVLPSEVTVITTGARTGSRLSTSPLYYVHANITILLCIKVQGLFDFR